MLRLSNLYASICILLSVVLVMNGFAEDTPAVTQAVNDPDFHKALLDVAAQYESYGRVDDEGRFAPWLCRMPNPSVARLSDSKDADTHGQKIYFLFAKNHDAYYALNKQSPADESPVGQVIVKESWVPKEVPASEIRTPLHAIRRSAPVSDSVKSEGDVAGALETFIPFVRREGKVFHADSKHALFIMLKMDPKTPNTDGGWIYGTVTADGKSVTSSGRVQSCMGCHQEAPHGRLFGLKKTEPVELDSKSR